MKIPALAATAVLALAGQGTAVKTRTLLQSAPPATGPFWVSEESLGPTPSNATFLPQQHTPVPAATYGGACDSSPECAASSAAVYRFCIPPAPATVLLATVPGAGDTGLTTGLYVFSVAGDAGPGAAFDAAAWQAPAKAFTAFATANAPVCATAAAPAVNACDAGPGGCFEYYGNLVCPSAGGPYLVHRMSELAFQHPPEGGAAALAPTCYYAAISSSRAGGFAAGLTVTTSAPSSEPGPGYVQGASGSGGTAPTSGAAGTAPAGAATPAASSPVATPAAATPAAAPAATTPAAAPSAAPAAAAAPGVIPSAPGIIPGGSPGGVFGGDPTLGAVQEGTQGNPRTSPYDLSAQLQLKPIPPGGTPDPEIVPVWIRFSDPLPFNCTTIPACVSAGLFDDAASLVFIYQNLCFQKAAAVGQATVQTTWGEEQTRDTNLVLYTTDQEDLYFDDRNAAICSDGSVPSCTSADPRACERNSTALCPAGSLYVSLSKITLPIPAGTGAYCLNAAIGAEDPENFLGKFGLQVTTSAAPA